jgi:hypothetical protein
MLTILTTLAIAIASFYLGRFTAPVVVREVVREATFPEPKERCYTITYFYSDGSKKTFHKCQGHSEFTDRFGREVAPEGATLLSAAGGVHSS